MICTSGSNRPSQRSTTSRLFNLSAVAAAALAAVLSATPAHAANSASGANALEHGAATVNAGVPVGQTAAPNLKVAAGPIGGGSEILSGQQLETVAPRPHDGDSGLFIIGPGATWNSNAGTATLRAVHIENNRASGHTGALQLTLWATTTLPVEANGITGFKLSSAVLNPLNAGFEYNNVSINTGFAPPPTGCYYMSLVLLENNLVADIRTFAVASGNNSPQPNGYLLFSFGGAACHVVTSCANGGTAACLLSGRFQVTAAYANDTTGHGGASVLSFGSTRAQSDESVFYFFTDPTNFELGVKVLDACSFSSSFWVFLGGLTNQGFGVTVLDTATGNYVQYSNAEDNTTVTTTDTTALPCP